MHIEVGIEFALESCRWKSDMLDSFKSFQLAIEYYNCCKKVRISHFLRDQLLRASSSIALNLAEGSAKRTPEDQRRFYFMALGSLRETQAILALEQISEPNIQNLADQLGACLFRLCHPNKKTEAQTGLRTSDRSDSKLPT